MLRTEKDLRPYQIHGVDHIIKYPYCGLFLGLGLGKTVTTLTAVNQLMYEDFEIRSVLVVAPLKVAQTVWHTEAKNWAHLKHLTFSLVIGEERKRKEALSRKADIYVINRENLVWLQAYYGGHLPFDMVVSDEHSSYKNHTSKRFKAFKVARPLVKRVVALTGTPMPNGLLDLWPQMYLLDLGQRLGKTITSYREQYFIPDKRKGDVIYSYKTKKVEDEDLLGANIYQREIFDKIGDICISMKTRDYIDLPPRTDIIDTVEMTPALREKYITFERDQVLVYLEGVEGGTITAANSAALMNSLMQFANGAIYEPGSNPGDKNRPFLEMHNLKLDALGEKLEAANGDPMLIFYSFKSDVVRIKKYLKEFHPEELDPRHTLKAIESWSRKEKRALLVHPASAGHGLNLQHGGHLMYWLQRPWSLELYEQGIGRVDRSGQAFPVFNWSAVIPGTVDTEIIDSHDLKAEGQEALMHAVKALVKKHTGVDLAIR